MRSRGIKIRQGRNILIMVTATPVIPTIIPTFPALDMCMLPI